MELLSSLRSWLFLGDTPSGPPSVTTRITYSESRRTAQRPAVYRSAPSTSSTTATYIAFSATFPTYAPFRCQAEGWQYRDSTFRLATRLLMVFTMASRALRSTICRRIHLQQNMASGVMRLLRRLRMRNMVNMVRRRMRMCRMSCCVRGRIGGF